MITFTDPNAEPIAPTRDTNDINPAGHDGTELAANTATRPIPDSAVSVTPVAETPSPKRRRRRTRGRLFAIACAALLALPMWSYTSYLWAPGNAPVAVRSVDWARDHGFSGIVNRIENWYYRRHPPKGSAPKTAELPTPSLFDPGAQSGKRSIVGLAAGPGALTASSTQPDPTHPSITTTAVVFDPAKVRFVSVPGTKQPGAGPWAWQSGIPVTQRSRLVAAFNSGFRFQDTPGGYYAEGRTVIRPLATGVAAIVIRRDGTLTIGEWGRDVSMQPDVVSVRQNLHLIVDHGAAVPGLVTNTQGLWGSRQSQLQYTWRSALGVDRNGKVIYVAGHGVTLSDMATSLVTAGAVRGLELDIHDKMVTFNVFRFAGPNLVTGTKLLPSMPTSPDRYLAADQRDFFAVVAR